MSVALAPLWPSWLLLAWRSVSAHCSPMIIIIMIIIIIIVVLVMYYYYTYDYTCYCDYYHSIRINNYVLLIQL